MRVYVTGGVCVEHDGVAVHGRQLPGPQAALLLAMLAIESHRVVSREELAETFWPGRLPPAWQTNLRSVVSRTRSSLRRLGDRAGSTLVAEDHGYRLRLDGSDWVDFAEAIRSVHAAESALASDRLEDAAGAAWVTEAIARRGLLDHVDGAWLDAQRQRLGRVRVRGLDCLAAALSALGDHDEAIRHAERAITLDPYRERSHRSLIAAHRRANDLSSAVRALRDCEALLDELGVRPTRATLDVAHRGLN